MTPSPLQQQFAHMATGSPYGDVTAELIEARQAAVLATNSYNASYGQPQADRTGYVPQH